MNPTAIVAWRGIIAAGVLAVMLKVQARRSGGVRNGQRPDPVVTPATVRQLWWPAFCFVAYISCWTASFAFISIGTAVVVVGCSSFITFLVASAKDRRFSALHLAGVALAIVAVIPTAAAEGGSNDDLLRGLVLAGAGAVFCAAYILSVDRPALRQFDPLRLWMLVSAGVGLIAGVLSLPQGALVDGLDLPGLGILLLLVAGPHITAQGLVVRLSTLGRPVLGNMVLVGETIGSAYLASLMVSEPVTAGLVLSAVMFAVAVVLLSRPVGAARSPVEVIDLTDQGGAHEGAVAHVRLRPVEASGMAED